MSGADKGERDGPLSRSVTTTEAARRSDGDRSFEFDRAIHPRMMAPQPPPHAAPVPSYVISRYFGSG